MTAVEQPAMLRVEGARLVSGDDAVVLRGFGLGGWMNMENFISGYAGSESQQRRALSRTLGDEGYRRFFDRFLHDFFTDDDAALMASLGLNSLRVPFNYRHFEDDDAPFEIKPEGFELLDRVVDACARHGIHTILDLHAVPGAQNQHWHSDNPTHWAHFWTHRHFQDRVVGLWEALAEHYRGNPWVAGYNPVNEPGDAVGEAIGPFYRRLEAAIPRERIFVLGSALLRHRPAEAVAAVLSFLGLPMEGEYNFAQKNRSKVSDPLPEPVLAELSDFFASHNARLFDHLGFEPEW